MTRLRGMMLEELERRKYSAGTTRCYLRAVADFARYFDSFPDKRASPQYDAAALLGSIRLQLVRRERKSPNKNRASLGP